MAEKAVFFAATKAWGGMHMKLTIFLAGARSAHEESQRSRQLEDWQWRVAAAREAGDTAAGQAVEAELRDWVLAELRRRDGALAELCEAFPLLAADQQGEQPGARQVKPQGEQTPADDEVEFYFADVFVFVSDYLAQMVRRRLNGSSATWCPRWWEHPEAGARLSALWLAWEHLRHDPALGMSTWWLHHADPHLRVLLDPDMGPFASCSPKDGHTAYPFDPLPVDPYDPGASSL